ncbi:MAG: HAD family phosphatase [Actinomycetales bacterium]|nr:HAD family phosphatase [Actinomycetales bacterium]
MASEFFDAVFFDMDGLTINSEPQWLEAEIELTKSFGYDWTQADQAACLGGPLSRVGQYMSDKTNGAKSGPEFHAEIVQLMAKKVSTYAEFMPGAKELLSQLSAQNVPLALVSASPRVIVDAALSHVKPLPFATTISSDDVENTKPDPEGYLKAASQVGADIKNCLILEDSATGVKAAQASGAKVIAVPHLVEIQPNSQTKIIRSLEELNFEILKEIFSTW